MSAKPQVRRVSAALIARIVGVETAVLINELFPSHWGSPGHWILIGSETYVTISRLPGLVESIRASGRHTGAGALEIWLLRDRVAHAKSAQTEAPGSSWYKEGQYA